ncbi:hypothetical protein [Bdellovibrio bacteriovorus]|uniref:Uncharacterized protein n=1 Tax=Bdellovibrio bacteriovorus TaxID=959 RepID=A0A150WVW5_BDEBC|nr:hypothetical protein [Bdellovibrio bacteriovorus]KYG68651.1 hypothetical protein AZI87_05290 [Bdellovibrio bacteriovorus]KYG70569.1 hypothetical protein AZI85_01100 [Bdellovibrio bacteriovorus]
MKKIVSLIVFLVALVWTWNVIHTSEAVGFETHSGIQLKLAELIGNTLTTKKPQAKDLSIMRLWTESLGDNKVRAVFAYKFIEPSEEGEELEQIIEGEAVLHREPSEDANTDKWVLQSVKTTNDIVVFTEGTTLTPGEAPETEEAAPTATPAATAAPQEATH